MVTESTKMAKAETARAPPPTSASSSNSNLAIVVDRRPPHRPGGCVGIFFQLFDWNRRLANKKLFSRKLLPQVRATKKISKKFAGDERMPGAKLLLIADENRGGFPSTTKAAADRGITDRGSDMCTPGLVARLMGLESMPEAVRHDKPRKAVDGASFSSNAGCYFVSCDTSGSSRYYQELGLQGSCRGHTKLDRRPQKLQKTGFFDRRAVAVARAGSEALLFNRNALAARSRKRHHKLASPVKSPRLLGRSSARFMVTATRILEPVLQARNQARCSLTYVTPLQTDLEGLDASLLSQRPSEPPDVPLVSPCNNCGNLVQRQDMVLKADEPSAAEYTSSDLISSIPHDRFNKNVWKKTIILKDERRIPCPAIQTEANMHSGSHCFVERKSHLQHESQEQRKAKCDASTSESALRQSNVRSNEITLIREKAAPAPKSSTKKLGRREPQSLHESKDFVTRNRNLGKSSQTRVAKTVDSRRMEMEGNVWDKKSLVRKRRSIGNITQIESTGAVNSTFSKERTGTREESNGKGTRLSSACSIHGRAPKTALQKMGAGGCGSGGKNNGTLSFSFSALAGNDALSSGSASERGTAGPHEGISQFRMPANALKAAGMFSCEREPDIKVDNLSALLEQKVRELACLDRDELAAGDNAQSWSTAAILEELIAALTASQSMPQKREHNSNVDLIMEVVSCHDSKSPSKCTNFHGPKFNIAQNVQLQAKERTRILPGILHSNDYDQPSPVSILEASFSNDSCLSESFNSGSGHQPQVVFLENSFDKSKSWEIDADLSDSATSSNVREIDSEKRHLSSDNISTMNSMKSHGAGPPGRELDYVREVMTSTDLLFGGTSLDNSHGKAYPSIDLIILGTVEDLLDAIRDGSSSNLCFPWTDKEFKFRRFLFDCIIEHLDMNYSHTTGYKSWMKLPILTRDRLTQKICKQIRSCRSLAGNILDEIVEMDMSCTNGKWTAFQAEAFETGIEIEHNLLELLIHETIIDLLQ